MAIYLNIPGVEGDVSTEGYQGWIQADYLHWGVERCIHSSTGISSKVHTALPNIKDITINKSCDQSSHAFLTQLLCAKSWPEVQIHYCNNSNPPTTYAGYQLFNVMVSNAEEIYSDSMGLPMEIIQLHFSKFVRNFTSTNNANSQQTPSHVGYDSNTSSLI